MGTFFCQNDPYKWVYRDFEAQVAYPHSKQIWIIPMGPSMEDMIMRELYIKAQNIFSRARNETCVLHCIAG